MCVSVTMQASPGNLLQLEDHIYSHADVNDSSCMAVKVATDGGTRKIGVAVVDTARFWIGVCEFVDNDQFSTFESVVVQQGAKVRVCDILRHACRVGLAWPRLRTA